MSAALAQPASLSEHVADCRQIVLGWLATALHSESVTLTRAELEPLADRLVQVAKSVKAA